MILPIVLALAQFQPAAAASTSPQPPLKCEKYQHVYHWPGNCGPQTCDPNGGCYAVCTPIPPDRCADDMHEITERDWQGLLARIEKLESGRSPDHALGDMRVPDGNVTLISPVSAAPAAPEAVITHEPYDGKGYEFPQDPFYSHYGPVWESPDGHWFQWDGKKWSPRKLKILTDVPKDTCSDDQHFHPKEMSPYIPDTRDEKPPIPDGRCHYNRGDGLVVQSQKKLEANR